MIGRLCTRVGAIAGEAAALTVALAKTQPCCVPAPPPGLWDYVLAGWIAAATVVLLAMLFQHLVTRQPLPALLTLGLWIVLLVGACAGIAGGLAPDWITAMVLGLAIGALLGWLICRICGRFATRTLEVTHG